MILRLSVLIAFVCAAALFVLPVTAAEASELRELKGVWQADFDAGASRIVVQLRNGALSLWDAASGKPLSSEFNTTAAKGQYLTDSAARRILVAFEEGGACVFDLNDGRALSPRIKVTLPLSAAPLPAAFTPDGAAVLLRGKSGACHVVRITDGVVVAEFSVPTSGEDSEASVAVSFSQDGLSALLVDGRGVLHRYDTRTWKESGAPMPHPSESLGSHWGFAAGEDHAFAVTWDLPGENGQRGNLQMWDLSTSRAAGQPIRSQNGATGQFLDGSRRLLVKPGRGSTRVLKVPSLEEDFVLPAHDDVSASFAAVTRDHRKILSWGYDRKMTLTNVLDGKRAGFFSSTARVGRITTGPDAGGAWVEFNNSAFQGHEDHYLFRFDLSTLRPAASVRILNYLHRTIFSRDGKRLMILEGGTDGERIRLFDAVTLKELPATKE